MEKFELSTKKGPHTKSICWKIVIERYGWVVILWCEKLDDFLGGSRLLLCSEFVWIDFSKQEKKGDWELIKNI